MDLYFTPQVWGSGWWASTLSSTLFPRVTLEGLAQILSLLWTLLAECALYGVSIAIAIAIQTHLLPAPSQGNVMPVSASPGRTLLMVQSRAQHPAFNRCDVPATTEIFIFSTGSQHLFLVSFLCSCQYPEILSRLPTAQGNSPWAELKSVS